ncbi:MAG: cell envelope integrity protein TolA [Stagnimonas sp.]|nr:cell envelope integrity protein TolA [Stagnimonas sp.]
MLFKPTQLLAALLMHVLLLGLLLGGVQCSAKPKPPEVIEASLLNPEQIGQPPPKPEPAKPEPPKPEPPKPEPPKPEPPKPEPPKEDPRKAEEAARQKVEQARLENERLLAQKAEAEALRVKAEAEALAKREAEELVRKTQEEEKQRKLAEEERKRKEEEAKRLAEEKARQDALQKQLQAEEDARVAKIIGAVQQTWQQQLSAAIARNWRRPPGLPNGLRCKVEIELLPNGMVRNVRVLRSSGVPAFDDSVVTAVLKSSPLPLPSDPRAFVAELAPTFDPALLESLGR